MPANGSNKVGYISLGVMLLSRDGEDMQEIADYVAAYLARAIPHIQPITPVYAHCIVESVKVLDREELV